MAPETRSDDESLKRLGGGRWETKDGRFTIEPASGTWSVLDAEETDDLGLPLVRGPFRSLTEAKAAITSARSSAAPASPLAGRAKRPAPASDDGGGESDAGTGRGVPTKRAKGEPAPEPADEAKKRATKAPDPAAAPQSGRSKGGDSAAEPEEPGWFRDLAPSERGRARRLIERLTAAGATDAVSIVRRDLVGDVPALAAHAIERRLAELPDDAGVARVAAVLADGRDDELGVRWRIVDGDGRPILIDVPKRSGRGR